MKSHRESAYDSSIFLREIRILVIYLFEDVKQNPVQDKSFSDHYTTRSLVFGEYEAGQICGEMALGRLIREEVAKLKQQPGQDILIYGSGELVHTLIQHDLINEYRLLVYPVGLGSGKRLFGDR